MKESLLLMMEPANLPNWMPYTVLQVMYPALMILMVILSVIMAIIVLLQSGNSSGLGAISGAAETFFGKNKARSMEGRFKRWTIIVASLLMFTSIFFFVFWQMID